MLPYFEFDSNGNKINFDFKNEAILMKTDNEYRKSIARPLDYVCRTSLLALSKKYKVILTSKGDTI